jgi:transcriptional accessory protein Tex/SPT6
MADQPTAPPGWLLVTFEPVGKDVPSPKIPAVIGKSSPKVSVSSIKRPLTDLRKGEQLEGWVKSTTDFGAFVDIGAEKDGLIHRQNLGVGPVDRVEEVIRRGDRVIVEIINVDSERMRIGLRLVEKK